MAFDKYNLSALAHANGFTLWHYKTDDVLEPGDNYFQEAEDMLNDSDIIICKNGEGIELVAVENTDGVVSISLVSFAKIVKLMRTAALFMDLKIGAPE